MGKTADQLQVGEGAIIVRLEGIEDVLARLRELGFVVGAQVQCSGHSPLGDPRLFSVGTATIALRKQEAKCLHVS